MLSGGSCSILPLFVCCPSAGWLLKFLVEAAPDDGAYGQLLREELSVLKDRDDSYLFHEHLEVNNTPLYFYQFAERMSAARLRYLGEADFASHPARIRVVRHVLRLKGSDANTAPA